jgi:hypothetical protein
LTGKPVASVINGVEFLRAIAGSRLEVAAEHGPFMPFGEAPARDGNPEQWGQQDDGGEQAILDTLRALAALQEHTATTLLVPDLDRVTRGDAREWQIVARILAGETVVDPRLGELTTELQEPPIEPFDGEHAFALVGELAVWVGEQHVALGHQILHVSAARVRQDSDRPSRLTVTPRHGALWTRTRTGPPDV